MTLAEAGEIFAYWEQNPPAHLVGQAVARLLGWSPPAPTTPVADIAAAPPPGLIVTRGGDLGLPPPVLDPAILRANNCARALAAAKREAQRAHP